MKRIISLIILAAFATTAMLISFSSDAEAIPAFARKEGAECTLCHVAFPKLNSFGFGYKQRGYRMEDTDGIWVWDGGVQFAGMLAFGVRYRNIDRPMAMLDSTEVAIVRTEAEFFSGGNLAPKVSYFMDFALEGAGEDDGEGVVAVGGTFVIFNDIMPDSLLNLKIGFQDATFYWLNPARKLGMAGYLGSEFGAGIGFDGASVEVNGILASDTRYQIGIANDGMERNGAVDPSPWTTDFSLNQYYVILDQMFEFAGAEQRVGFAWINNRVGADNDNTFVAASDTNRTTLLGGSLDLNIPIGEQPLNLVFAYFSFNDTSGTGTSTGDYNNYLVEAILPVGEKIVFEALYDNLDIDGTEAGDRERWAVGGHYYVAPNVDVILEYMKTRTSMNASGTNKMTMDMLMLMFHLGF